MKTRCLWMVLILCLSMVLSGCFGGSKHKASNLRGGQLYVKVPAPATTSSQFSTMSLRNPIESVRIEIRIPDGAIVDEATVHIQNGAAIATFTGLAPRDYIVDVTAIDSEGNKPYRGWQTVIVRAGETSTVEILLSSNPAVVPISIYIDQKIQQLSPAIAVVESERLWNRWENSSFPVSGDKAEGLIQFDTSWGTPSFRVGIYDEAGELLWISDVYDIIVHPGETTDPVYITATFQDPGSLNIVGDYLIVPDPPSNLRITTKPDTRDLYASWQHSPDAGQIVASNVWYFEYRIEWRTKGTTYWDSWWAVSYEEGPGLTFYVPTEWYGKTVQISVIAQYSKSEGSSPVMSQRSNVVEVTFDEKGHPVHITDL